MKKEKKTRKKREESINIIVTRPSCPTCGCTDLKVVATHSREECAEVVGGKTYNQRVRRLTRCQSCNQNVSQICLENK